MSPQPRRYRRTPRSRRPKETPIIEVKRKDNTSPIYSFAVIFTLLAVVAIAALNHLFILNLIDFFKIFICTYLLLIAIPIKVYRKKFTISFYEFFIFNFILTTPAILLIIFSLNYFIVIDHSTETYPVERVRYYGKSSMRIVTLKNKQYIDNEAMRTIYNWNEHEFVSNRLYEISYATGIFGIKMYEFQKLY